MDTDMIVGGLSETKPATPEIQKIVDEVKSQLEQKTNEKYDCFEAVQYRSQVVAGSVYYVKVHIGCNRYVHLNIYEPLPHRNERIKLSDYQTGKTKEDEITSFRGTV
ncbi:cystatin-A-like [Trichosurus vulpecula]|uniref:cystatin-A-like n=1 Tax=Trichosurus vulpecula TaxID=9337 RepID=UPI00186AC3CF|nr:cystatin-A-like [Trichosurus vulpecula]